jgi:hypothetical protein
MPSRDSLKEALPASSPVEVLMGMTSVPGLGVASCA